MNEQLIRDAAEAKIKELFNALFQAFTTAAGDAAAERVAEERFRTGVVLVKRVRDRAISNLSA